VSAAKDNQVYRIDDLEADDRWPGFANEAGDMGIKSVLSTPHSTGGSATGALNLYSFAAGAFAQEAQDTATVLARHATIAIANRHALGDGEHLANQLREAILSREVIGEAKGILMERDGLSSDEAFDALRALSQSQNRKLRTIAEEIVRTASDRRRENG
jgi:GAF domain-containing protein